MGRIRPGIEQAVRGEYAGTMRGVYIDEASLKTWTNIEAVLKKKQKRAEDLSLPLSLSVTHRNPIFSLCWGDSSHREIRGWLLQVVGVVYNLPKED